MTGQTLLVVEDDPFHLRYLEERLSDSAFSMLDKAFFDNSERANEWLRSRKADFAILDLQMPGQNGIAIARNVWRRHPESSVVFWSNFSDPAYVGAIAKIVPENGNFGYLLKTTASAKLQRSLQGVFFDRQRIVDSEVRGFIKRQHSRGADLTAVEIEILNLVALGLTDRSLADLTGRSGRSVQSAIHSINEKLQDRIQDDIPGHPGLNRRARMVAIALLTGEINRDSMAEYQARHF